MNENHQQLCPSPEWAAYLCGEVLPWLTEQAELGDEMLEIGPGPGAATGWLQDKVKRLTAIEIDQAAAARLAAQYEGSNVEIVTGDATELPWPADSFDSVGCFTMLHHVPAAAMQNKILAEALRILRPGGALLASDSLPGTDLHDFHAGDTYNPIDPGSVITRLQTVGFDAITVRVDGSLRFVARKPAPRAGREECADETETR